MHLNLRSIFPLPTAIGLVLALCCQSAAASHADLCRHLAEQTEDADLETQQALVMSPCPEVSLKALIRSEELALADPESAADWLDDEDSRQELEWFRLSHQLKLALHSGNVARARPLLDQAEVSLERDLDLPEAEADLVMDVAAIRRVLDGHEPTSTPFKIQAPGQPWVPVRHERTCGTGQFMALMLSWTTPEPADAWLARNRPDLALSAHLAQHWVENIAELNLPPRLREFAERAFGPERANAEFEAALASVRIESRPLGTTAVLSLFGHSLPLPTGEIVYARFRAEGDPPPEPTFYSEMQIAEQLRTAWQTSGVEGFLELSDLDVAIEETTEEH